MYLLDTDALTHFWKGNQQIINNIRMLDDPDVHTTIVTKVEMLRGRFDYLLKASTSKDVLRAQQLLL